MNQRVAVVIALAVGVAIGMAVAALRPSPPPPPPPPPVPTLVPPMHDAQVGEWARIESGVDAQLFRIVGVSPDDHEIKVEMVQSHEGTPSGPPVTLTWHRNSWSLPADCVIRAIDRDRIEVAGKHYDCWRLTVFSHVRNMVYWISDEVPVHGVLKIAVATDRGIDEMHAARFAEGGFAPK
jgi:hypothetical protein